MTDEQQQPELNYTTLLEWCHNELKDVHLYRVGGLTQYQTGILDGVSSVLNSLILYFDLEGK